MALKIVVVDEATGVQHEVGSGDKAVLIVLVGDEVEVVALEHEGWSDVWESVEMTREHVLGQLRDMGLSGQESEKN